MQAAAMLLESEPIYQFIQVIILKQPHISDQLKPLFCSVIDCKLCILCNELHTVTRGYGMGNLVDMATRTCCEDVFWDPYPKALLHHPIEGQKYVV